MKKQKGFTLVELLITISILGILTIIAIPTLRALQARNQKTQYKNYGQSLIASSKLYIDSYSEDLFGNLDYGCQKVSLTELINKNLAKDISLKDITCNNSEKDSLVLVWKNKTEYNYQVSLNCENSKGKSVYNTGDDFVSTCFNAITKPLITAETEGEASDSTEKSIRIILNDEFGFTANQEIEYAWSQTKVDKGIGITGFKNYKYHNGYKKRENNETVRLKTTSIRVPSTVTNPYYLYVKPIKVQNIVNESLTEIQRFGPYQFDNSAPACPKLTATNASGTELPLSQPVQLSKFNISFTEEDLQSYDIQVSYDNGSSWGDILTFDKSITEYVPIKDGMIKINVRGRDNGNNISDWCEYGAYIRDTTKPTPPNVKGYKKPNSSAVTSSSGLTEHPTDTWVNSWLFVKASGSSDTNGADYYYKITGAKQVDKTQGGHVNVNDQKVSTVSFRACDDANNCSAWVSYIVKLDRTAPKYDTICFKTCPKHENKINHNWLYIAPYDEESYVAYGLYHWSDGVNGSKTDKKSFCSFKTTEKSLYTNSVEKWKDCRYFEANNEHKNVGSFGPGTGADVMYYHARICDAAKNCNDTRWEDLQTIRLNTCSGSKWSNFCKN